MVNEPVKKNIREIIVVEGRYDVNSVKSAVNATVVETSGFGILNNKDKITLLRKLAEKQGLIILTDSDRAGFFIRGRLKSLLGINIKHAYIPDIKGKEKRKVHPSKEGKTGVEGMSRSVILKALESAGATFDDDSSRSGNKIKITKTDLYDLDLCGKPNSMIKRKELLKLLNLPERLSTNGLLDVLNILYSRDEFIQNTIYKI